MVSLVTLLSLGAYTGAIHQPAAVSRWMPITFWTRIKQISNASTIQIGLRIEYFFSGTTSGNCNAMLASTAARAAAVVRGGARSISASAVSAAPTGVVMMNMGGPSSLHGERDGVKPFLTNLFQDSEIIPLGPLQSTLVSADFDTTQASVTLDFYTAGKVHRHSSHSKDRGAV